MFRHLSLIDNEWVKEMIISQNQRLGYHKRDFLEARLDELIAHYGIKDAEKDEKYTALYKTQDKIIDIITKEKLGFYLTGGTALQRFRFYAIML